MKRICLTQILLLGILTTIAVGRRTGLGRRTALGAESWPFNLPADVDGRLILPIATTSAAPVHVQPDTQSTTPDSSWTLPTILLNATSAKLTVPALGQPQQPTSSITEGWWVSLHVPPPPTYWYAPPGISPANVQQPVIPTGERNSLWAWPVRTSRNPATTSAAPAQRPSPALQTPGQPGTLPGSAQFAVPNAVWSGSHLNITNVNRTSAALPQQNQLYRNSLWRWPVRTSNKLPLQIRTPAPSLPGTQPGSAQFATPNAVRPGSQSDTTNVSRNNVALPQQAQQNQLDRNPAHYESFAKPAQPCNHTACKLPNCLCGAVTIPGSVPLAQTPQIIMITFDDAVNSQNNNFYSTIFRDGRVNPNGCPIKGTFYVSHEWTDYTLVQNLYSEGHEIASHSISHTMPAWNATKMDWAAEIAGQREILSRLGNVDIRDIKGMRAPFLQLGGNRQFEMLWEQGFLYDSSITVAQNNPPMWPYTLDYELAHTCMMTPCPTKSYPGLWEVPLVHWEDSLLYPCSMADACRGQDSPNQVYQLMMKNFKRHYETNRAPFGMFYHASWLIDRHHEQGFLKFLDTVLTMPDVYVVTSTQALEWIQNPTPLSAIKEFKPWKCDMNPSRPSQCLRPTVCAAPFRGGMRDVKTCSPCPDSYPWVKNNVDVKKTKSAPVSGNTI